MNPPLPEMVPVGIVVASKGRPEVMRDLLRSLERQTLRPKKIVVVVPSPEDFPSGEENEAVQVIIGPLGGSVQRNVGIAAIPLTFSYVAIFDDDFEPRDDYLEKAARFMQANPSVMALTGQELWGELPTPREIARRMNAAYDPAAHSRPEFASAGRDTTLFGCNMMFRRDILERERFDENLPLYSFGEDFDLTVRLRRHGQVGRFQGAVGVHLEVKGGRVRELQRGYAQIANNWYFLRKGSILRPYPISWLRFWYISGKFTRTALWHVLKGDRSADWRGRLRGYLLAMRDILLGRSDPKRVCDL